MTQRWRFLVGRYGTGTWTTTHGGWLGLGGASLLRKPPQSMDGVNDLGYCGEIYGLGEESDIGGRSNGIKVVRSSKD